MSDVAGVVRRCGLVAALCLALGAFAGGCGGNDDSSSGGGGGGKDNGNVFSGGGDCKDADDALRKAAADHVIPVTIGKGKGQAEKITTEVCRTSDDNATAVVEVFGLNDPSVKDVHHEIRLVKTGGLWQVTDDADTRRCQPGKGSQEFAGSVCH